MIAWWLVLGCRYINRSFKWVWIDDSSAADGICFITAVFEQDTSVVGRDQQLFILPSGANPVKSFGCGSSRMLVVITTPVSARLNDINYLVSFRVVQTSVEEIAAWRLMFTRHYLVNAVSFELAGKTQHQQQVASVHWFKPYLLHCLDFMPMKRSRVTT